MTSALLLKLFSSSSPRASTESADKRRLTLRWSGTSTGMALGPRASQCHHPSRVPSAIRLRPLSSNVRRHITSMPIYDAATYESELRKCTKCAPLLAQYQVDPPESPEAVLPRPIVRPLLPCPVMLIGQAPGLTEYRTGRPFSGPAGRDARAIFVQAGLDDARFERFVFTSAVAKCFPGSKLVPRRRTSGVRREDVKPSAEMLRNCSPFLLAQLNVVNPRTVVLLGKMALEVFLELTTGRRASVQLDDYVGRLLEWNGRNVIPLAHTSGASTWLNQPERKALQQRAMQHLREQLAEYAR